MAAAKTSLSCKLKAALIGRHSTGLYQYEKEVLDALHAIETDMLRTFVRICDQYNIPYFLTFGTAIGALRHQGFVPWDDDIDIGMMREDWEKLKKVPASEWGEELFIADCRDDYALHRNLFPRLYRKGTAFETNLYLRYWKPKTKEAYPIYIDIFLFDRVDSLEHAKKQIKRANYYKSMLLYAKCSCHVPSDDSFITKAACVAKKGIHHVLRIRKDSAKRLYERYKAEMERYGGDYVTSFELVDDHEKFDCFCGYDAMFPTRTVKFEGMDVKIQKNCEEILTKLYGDFMQLPPVEKRYNAAPNVLDLGDGNGNVIKKEP